MEKRTKGAGAANLRTIFHLLMVLTFLLGTIALLPAQTLSVSVHESIAPESIPVPQSGTYDIGMTRMRMTATVANATLSQVSVELTQPSGTFDAASITDIKVYIEEGNGKYDNGGTQGGALKDYQIDTAGTTTFSGSSATIDLQTDHAQNVLEVNSNHFIFIVFTIDSSANPLGRIGCEITNVVYGPEGDGTGASVNSGAYGLHGDWGYVDKYEIEVDSSTGIAPVSADQGTLDVPVAKLVFTPVDTDLSTYGINIDSLTVTLVGTGNDVDVASSGVQLYDDSGGSAGSFDAGDILITAGDVPGGGSTAILTPTADLQIPSGGATYYIAVNVAVGANPGNQIGFQIADPSSDIQYIDIEGADPSVFVQYATQIGYTTLATAVPSTGSWVFEITEYIPFVVTQFTPAASATDVPRESDVTAKFTKDVDDTTLAGNFTLVGAVSGAVTATLSYDAGQKKATLDPDTDLNWAETYTATVTTSVLDSEGNPLEAQQQWSFTVEPAVYPTVLSTVPADGDTNVARDVLVKATFSENVNGVNGSSFTLYQGATPIAGTVSYDGPSFTATFTPSTTLDYNTQYTATITTAVYDDDDLYLQTDKVWDFWTLAATPPVVLSVFPANGSTDVPIGSTVQAVFSKPIDDTTLDANFTVEDYLGSPISGTITYDAGSFTATFTPAAPFRYLKTYTATIATGVTDSEGTALSIGKTWDFTTFGFEKATVVNNRIVSGGNSETLIFVPAPPNTSDKVSVQVFTTTGRLVRTFYRNATYSAIESQLPITWNGTNDRGQDLGPGMYFVQIVVAGTKQTLKVMIVR